MDSAYVLQALINGIMIGGVYALIAVGLSIVWGVMGIVNFAHGDWLMLSAYFSWIFYMYAGLDPLISLPLVVAIFILFGFANYKFIMKRFIDAPIVISIVATFSISLIMRFGAFIIFKPDYRLIKDHVLEGVYRFGEFQVSRAKFATFLIMIAALLLLFSFLKYTKTGKAIRATAQDRDVAKSLGVNVDRIFLITWGIGLACVAVAGTMISTFFYVFPMMGISFLLLAFASVALGGFGSVHGAVFGGIVIGIVQQLGGALVYPAFKDVFVFVIFILMLMFKPKGLFGKY